MSKDNIFLNKKKLNYFLIFMTKIKIIKKKKII